jgi:hypothetical protein
VRISITALICLLFLQPLFGQLQSPERFLGYKIGTHFTPHSRIVEYFKSVAAAVPSQVKFQEYGRTNEGRPLVVVYVSNPSNISQLESIRSNNLKLAKSLPADNSAGNLNSPAIVWLSYNVHGNEPASSEAAMLTLYALVDPVNKETKQWLQNTVVVMDPCINPDGRDRYVNWYNSIVGSEFNPSPAAREHIEPWPRGRTNHYNFDLNRDWAWQTQIESQQRIALYNQWLPQVHVDFHEQGYNEPYYFAPAAEPFHEVITQWQRDFQSTIGRNHAKYFDANGWLYFTKERFDLLYPSYGDTYPLYNGAIGMTYEQGGIGGGLGVITDAGDTLTLVDRVNHHYTTGLSTIEVASKNAVELLTEYQKYYTNAMAGIGEYKTYVIKKAKDSAKVNALLGLLRKNNIRYYCPVGSTIKGYNYDSGKEESFTISKTDIIIPAAQPKSNLLKVLFEPRTVLTDSATYDITAWSLPYAYGIKAYATRASIISSGPYKEITTSNSAADGNPYAYVIPWTSIQSARVVSDLLQKGIKLRFVTEPFQSGGQTFDRGSVIALKTGNQGVNNLWGNLRQVANEAGVKLTPVATGFVEKGFDFGSVSVLPLKLKKAALITGEGVNSNAAGEIWYYLEKELNYPVTLINAADTKNLKWSDYDLVILPDGNYNFLSDKTASDGLKSWLSSGGNLIALEGAVAQLSKLDWSIKAKKTEEAEAKDKIDYLQKFENRERDFISGTTPGSIFKVHLDNTHPLAFGYPDYYYTLKQDNSIYEFFKENGWNVGVLKKEKQVAGFVGSKLTNQLQNGLLFGVQEVGKGTVTYLTDDVLFRDFWQNGKLMFANAILFVGH